MWLKRTPRHAVNDTVTDSPELSREKRFEPLTIGVVVAILFAGGALGLSIYNTVKVAQMEGLIAELAELQKRHMTMTVANAQKLVGLSEVDIDAFRQVNSQVKSIGEIFEQELAHMSHFVMQVKDSNTLTNTVLLHLIEQLDLTEKTSEFLHTLRRRISDYESGLNQLKQGYLPTEFISFNRLREILSVVEQQLVATRYQLGIPFSEIDRYYLHKLARFTVVKGEIWIRLMVPLTVEKPGQEIVLFHPVFHPIPPPATWDTEHDFVRMAEKVDFWLYKKNQLLAVAERNRMNCITIAHHHECMMFFEHPHDGRSACLRNMYEGNWTAVGESCPFEDTDQIYTPINLRNGSYIIHRSGNLAYTLSCHDEFEHRPIVFLHDTMAITVPETCALRVNNKLVPGIIRSDSGTFSYRLIGAPGKFVDQGSEVKIIHSPQLLIRPKWKIPPVDMRAKIAVHQALVSSMDEMTQKAAEMTVKADEIISRTRTYNEWIIKVTEIVFDVLMLVVIFFSVKNSSWFIGCPLIVTHVPSVRAVDFTISGAKDLITSYAQHVSVFDWLSFASVVAKILVVLIILLTFWLMSCKQKIDLSSHVGTPAFRARSRYYLSVSLTLPARGLMHTKEQLVTLFVPLNKTFPVHAVSVHTVRSLYHWQYTCSSDTLEITELIIVRALDSQGHTCLSCVEKVSVNIERTSWDSDLVPMIPDRNAYGTAVINAVPDPAPIA